jgi:[pyruvate, water dikinase]-phosphate phosphotransferase / [pyruvate, water dikinase] kinase
MIRVFAVSDGTGATAERLLQAAILQFVDAEVEIQRRTQVRTPQQVRGVVDEAAAQKAILLHTLVSDELRRLILQESRQRGVDSLDLLGPILERLAQHLQLTPQEKPGLFRQLAEARSREIEAVDFAFRHDDGQNVQELPRAEIVLVGISRTMKTPTTLYLAYRGWFVANVPLVPELPLAEPLLDIPASRVFCLAMAPGRLRELRLTRAENTGIPAVPYAAMEQIREELNYAAELCLNHGWHRIDTTGKSVEEVSREIVLLLPDADRARQNIC